VFRAAVILTAALLVFQALTSPLVLAESLLAAAPFEMLFLFRQKKGTNRLMTYVTMFSFSQGG
jgi:hypothetical protein